MAKNPKTPTPPPTPTTGDVDTAPSTEHRVLINEVSDPLRPRVAALVIVATSNEEAVKIVNELDDPFTSQLPRGCYRSQCRLEEVLPFARNGFGIRRQSWPAQEVALRHPGIGTRFDVYLRNMEQPLHTPTHIRELAHLSGPDLLSEDWAVSSRPPTFGNRRSG